VEVIRAEVVSSQFQKQLTHGALCFFFRHVSQEERGVENVEDMKRVEGSGWTHVAGDRIRNRDDCAVPIPPICVGP
jgi:hypothetical protein